MDWAAFPPPLLERAIKKFLCFCSNFTVGKIEDCVKFFEVHNIKILQTIYLKYQNKKHQNARSIDEKLKTNVLCFIFFHKISKHFAQTSCPELTLHFLSYNMTRWWCHWKKHPWVLPGQFLFGHHHQVILHSWFLEPWNREKSLCNIWQRFSYLLDEWIAKISKKKFFHGGFLR